MHAGAWVLVILSSAGLLLAVAGVLQVLRGMGRLSARLETLANSRLATSIAGLEIEGARLEAMSRRAAPLLKRGQAALAEIRQNARDLNPAPAREAMQQAGRDISALAQDLR